MGSMKIILDSTGDIPFEWLKEKDITNIPLHILWEDPQETEEDIREISEIQKYWERIQTRAIPSKTSQPTPAEFSVLYEKILKEGYSEILSVCVSSTMSGTYSSAEIAAKNFPGKIEVIDTKMASSANALVCRRARELSDQGFAVGKVKATLEKEIKEHRFGAYFYVSDFEFLKKGGRVSRFASFLGSMLKLRVSIFIAEDGNMLPFAKNKGVQKTQDSLIKAAKSVFPENSKVNLVMVYTINPEEAKSLQAKLSSVYQIQQVLYSPMGKVISSHVGPYATGFGIEKIS